MNIQRYFLSADGKLTPSDAGELVLFDDVMRFDMPRAVGQLNGIIAVLVGGYCKGAVSVRFQTIKNFAESGKALKVTITDDNQDIVLRVMDAEEAAV